MKSVCLLRGKEGSSFSEGSDYWLRQQKNPRGSRFEASRVCFHISVPVSQMYFDGSRMMSWKSV